MRAVRCISPRALVVSLFVRGSQSQGDQGSVDFSERGSVRKCTSIYMHQDFDGKLEAND